MKHLFAVLLCSVLFFLGYLIGFMLTVSVNPEFTDVETMRVTTVCFLVMNAFFGVYLFTEYFKSNYLL